MVRVWDANLENEGSIARVGRGKWSVGKITTWCKGTLSMLVQGDGHRVK